MSMQRRSVATAAALCLSFSAMLPNIGSAAAQTWPTRPVRVLVGFAAGSPSDILARLMGQWLSERVAQPFVIENRPGAGGNIATEAVVRATPDGYTLLLVSTSDAVNATLYEKQSFNFIRDITPVASIFKQPLIMLVNPSLPAKTLVEFIAYAKANPGKVNMASPGNGTGPHVAGELFKMMTGVDMAHVPYRGAAPALADLIGGQVQLTFIGPATALDHIKTGKLRALAVTSATRSDTLPDVPSVTDVLPGYEAGGWWGIGAPKTTPVEIVDKLNREINTGLADPKMKAQLANLGGTVMPGSPAEFGSYIAAETERMAKVVRAAKMKVQ